MIHRRWPGPRARASTRSEEGQILPVLLLLFAALAAAAVLLFQVGRTATLASEATTAADAAALGAAQNVREQLYAQVPRLGYADVSLVSHDAAWAAADEWARRNGGRVTALDVNVAGVEGIDVYVEVETLEALSGEGARDAESEGVRAENNATARLMPTFLNPSGVANLGITSASFGVIEGRDWREFKEQTAGQPLDVVALGRFLQQFGYSVGEHPAFGGVCACHVAGSWHYVNGAVDVNADHFPYGEMAAIDAIVPHIREMGYNVLWRVEDHFDHLHVDVGGPGGGELAGTGYGPAVFEVVLVE